MKTIVIFTLALAVGSLIACSESPTEGCWITHANGVKLEPSVQFPVNAEHIAMNPGDSYEVWCAREIRDFSAGEIISADQQTLRIARLPADVSLEIRPNERDAVYRGHPVPSSENVWDGFADASGSMVPNDWRLTIGFGAVAAIVLAAVAAWMRRSNRQEVPDGNRF